MMMGTRKKGFTLIELLVVIAIIAILAAILFPIFVRVQESARMAKCLNNAKQIAGGCMLYEGDYDGTMLQGFGNGSGTWGDWYSLVNPYIRQMNNTGTKANPNFDLRGVWLCPDIPRSRYSDGSEIPTNLKRAYGYNYAYLGGVAIPMTSPTVYDSHKSSEMFKATKTIRILEIWGYNSPARIPTSTKGWGTAYCYPPIKQASICKPTYCWPPGWHSGGRSTVGWCDGHVSTVVLCPPEPPGAAVTANPFTGIMLQYTGGTKVVLPADPEGDNRDPYFRLTAPKP